MRLHVVNAHSQAIYTSARIDYVTYMHTEKHTSHAEEISHKVRVHLERNYVYCESTKTHTVRHNVSVGIAFGYRYLRTCHIHPTVPRLLHPRRLQSACKSQQPAV